jgi:hypothetical protein
MKSKVLVLAAAVAALSFVPQETPKTQVSAYDALADAILAVKRSEAEFVRSILDRHYQAASHFAKAGDSERAAAEIALFANEGDNAIGGVRKRLLEGGHHHNAEGEAQGIYDEGFVLITKKNKEAGLAISAAMRQAKDDAARKDAWGKFEALAKPIVSVE